MNIPDHSPAFSRIIKWAPAILLLMALFFGRIAQAATIDIMLVYDTTATAWVESEGGGMEAFSIDAVNQLNMAMENSEVNIVFRLVHSVSVDYTHVDLETDLYAITDGYENFSGVHTLRDEYGADLVALLVDTGSPSGWVGLGWTLWAYAGTPDHAFTANAIRAVDISHTLTHEVGHNLGAGHAKDQASSPGPNIIDNEVVEYSAGWYFTGTNADAYHTIMAYPEDKDNNGWPDNSVPLFSTPLVTHEGTPAGDSLDGDNARLLRDTMDVVAAYRSTVAVGSLEVTIEPPEVRNAGAQWRRTGTDIWLNSGVIENNLPTGDHIVEFKTVGGWDKPWNKSVTIFASETTTATGTYTLKKQQAMPWIQLLLLD